jgi:hypothetical protein
MSSRPAPAYIEGPELMEQLAVQAETGRLPAGDACASVGVVDVRDDDWVCGHVRGGAHVPAGDLADAAALDALVAAEAARAGDARRRVVFHCFFSQVRGPRCARAFAAAVARLGLADTLETCVLRDGFKGLALHESIPTDERYKGLFEDLDLNWWKTQGSSC